MNASSGNRSSKPRAVGSLPRHALVGVGIGLVCALACLPGGPLYSLELKALDTRFRYRDPLTAGGQVVIVAVDERSIADPRLGRWEWDRIWHARLIEKLAADKPRAVAFDIIFADPSRGGSHDDERVAEATARAGNVIYAAYAGQAAARPKAHPTAQQARPQPGIVIHQDAVPQLPTVVPPLASLAESSAGIGVIAARPDQDGILRRAFFLVRDGATGGFVPTLELAAAARGMGWDFSHMRFDAQRDIQLAPGRRIPLDSDGNALINYLGPAGTIPQYSFVDVVDGRAPPGTFHDKIVLVGFTASGLQDYFPTPFPGGMFGVEIHAQVIDNLLTGAFLKSTETPSTIGLALILAVVGALAAGYLRPLVGLAFLTLTIVVYNAMGLHALNHTGVVLPVLGPSLAAFLSCSSIATVRLAAEEAGRRRLRDEFGRYAPPQMVARLDAGEMQVRSAGTVRPISAVFADIRGFTAWSAKTDPREVVAVLNDYYEAMTQLAFDLGGTVDNIVGDEIFVTFNVLDDQDDHVQRAADLAVNMVGALDGLNRRWLADGVLPEPLRIGVGINAGDALVGNLGSSVRTQYTALGEVVNLASRLQSLNKELGTTILTTRELGGKLDGSIQTRNMGSQDVRGHPVPVEVLEIVGRAPAEPA